MPSQNCKIQVCLPCGLLRPLPLKSSSSSNRSENTQYGLSISGGETLAVLSFLHQCLLGGFPVAPSLIATKDATENREWLTVVSALALGSRFRLLVGPVPGLCVLPTHTPPRASCAPSSQNLASANCFQQPCLPEIQTQVCSRCQGRDAWKAAFFSVVHAPLTGEADACPGAKLMGLSLLLLYKGPGDSPMDSCA